MYYMNARYYDPETGRFISQDTYRGEDDDAGTWHLYSYCSNNPINHTDPSGHKRRVVGFGLQATLTIGSGFSAGGISVALIWFNNSVERYNGKSFHMYIGGFGDVGSSLKKDAHKLMKNNPKKLLYKRGLNKIKKKFKKRNSKELKKIKKPHLAASAGFFFIYGKDSFKKYSDYKGAFGCLSVSFNHASVTFATGKLNIDLGAAITTEKEYPELIKTNLRSFETFYYIGIILGALLIGFSMVMMKRQSLHKVYR